MEEAEMEECQRGRACAIGRFGYGDNSCEPSFVIATFMRE
jgi:hypothetical protein